MMSNSNSSEILALEELSLLILCGASGSGKTEFARRWFRESEIISLEQCSMLVSDQTKQESSLSSQAYKLLKDIVEYRLQLGRLTVVDAYNLNSEWRRSLVKIARHHQLPAYLLIFDTPLQICLKRQQYRSNQLDSLHITIQHSQVMQARNLAKQEGFRQIFLLSQFNQEGPLPLRQPLMIRDSHPGSFDIIGDIHGCLDELKLLLKKLGYQFKNGSYVHPQDRMLVFLGDLTDRGPNSIGVLRLVLSLYEEGRALYVPGNHCDKFARFLGGSPISRNYGIETTIQELQALSTAEQEELSERFLQLFHQSSPYLMFDNDRLLVAHAGLPERFHFRLSKRIKAFSLYGDVTGELDADGYPVRHDWAQKYRGSPLVVYGHTPTLAVSFINNTVNLDQGCVFGGSLSALRYPERELISIPAQKIYWKSQNPRHTVFSGT